MTRRVVPSWGHSGGSVAALAVVVFVSALAITAGASGSASRAALADCTIAQLRLSGRLTGATQSLLGALVLTNRSERACALPAAPRRASVVVGSQVLPTLTVRLRGGRVPPGTPTRTLPRRGRVTVGFQWRNWCGVPRAVVRASLVLTIFPAVTPRATLGPVRTPTCVDRKLTSVVAVSRFLKPSG